ncbi:HNH endonuclease [Rhodospirillaceae bacterium KN72]|uniref:HNH endonuclease n=1 Tax=Pacificispira spongiicola TaxID=2729598 RepID=A0A7Y0DZB0_9PROT|nr:HNH endonuclease [Pacificispira spongiicola]NMM43606.1 HNH endonuclease [Pacificispira spongiicola]
MSADPRSIAERVSLETGLAFTGSEGRDGDGSRWLELRPAEHPAGQTFTLRTIVGWRRIDVLFRPGNFAGELIEAMGSAEQTGRQGFRAVLGVCRDDGADIALSVNGAARDPNDDGIWTTPWRSLDLAIRRGMLAINDGDADADMRQIELWTSRAAAAVLSLLPLEANDDGGEEPTPEIAGLPEGAKTRIEVNRYERDRRNRAAALAIHGYLCKACDLDMGERYGPDAAGLIEVHHVTPVSEVGPGYIIDPRTDLVPLCPNCHAVAHRRAPPFTVDELRKKQGRA